MEMETIVLTKHLHYKYCAKCPHHTFSVQLELTSSGSFPQCSALIAVDLTFIVAGNPFDIVSKC